MTLWGGETATLISIGLDLLLVAKSAEYSLYSSSIEGMNLLVGATLLAGLCAVAAKENANPEVIIVGAGWAGMSAGRSP
jgi:hypothetical protein